MRLPLGPTLLVAVAVPALIALGFWQLQRREEKALFLAALARPITGVIPCARLDGPVRQIVGRSLDGRVGYRHRASCWTGQASLPIDLGWTARPTRIALPAGPQRIDMTLVRLTQPAMLIVARAPRPPLEPSAPPSARDIPNNHLSYAIQWFSFAAILALIYALYVRRWNRDRGLRSRRHVD